MTSAIATWRPEAICLRPSPAEMRSLAAAVYGRTCRTDFASPGFCAVDLGTDIGSAGLRRLMVDLVRSMASIHEATTGDTLIYLSAARFDQQESTRPHLDGGPDQCFLMLGYEPSDVESDLEISDYARCASDLGLSPKEFMVRHNPMFQSGHELLRPYTTRIPCFSARGYRIVCINNSSAPYSDSQPAWQGVLHTAAILTPDDSKRRIINSTMIAPAPAGTPDAVSAEDLDEFVATSAVRRRGYDRPHLQDDA